MSDTRTLIAYFSRSATRRYLQKKSQTKPAERCFLLRPFNPNPSDYTKTTEVAAAELRQNAWPELTKTVAWLASYEVIYLGYRNWWRTMPMAVFTFLEAYDFFGKIVRSFCIHEGNGMGHRESDIRKLCPQAEVLPGLAIRGGSVAGIGKILNTRLKKN